MSKSKKQLKKDLKYLKKHLDDNKEINQIIKHTEKIGISSAQYFCEEFVFIPDGETPEDVQDSTMLSILTLQSSTIIIG